MADESIIQAERPAKRRPLRPFFWVLAAGFGLMFLLNVLFPDLDLSTEDRIALIRVEGVIMDSPATSVQLAGQQSQTELLSQLPIGRIADPGEEQGSQRNIVGKGVRSGGAAHAKAR